MSLSQHDGGTLTVDLDGRYALADTGGLQAQSVFDTVHDLSATWASTNTDVNTNSAYWDWAYSNSLSGTDLWNWAHANSISGTDIWNSTNTDVNANSALWTSVYSTVKDNSGTGTNNYVARWTSTTKIGDSIIYDTGTNAGIGTTTPEARFVVSGGNVFHPVISATNIYVTSLTALTSFTVEEKTLAGNTTIDGNLIVRGDVNATTFNSINIDSVSIDVHANSAYWDWAYNNSLSGKEDLITIFLSEKYLTKSINFF